MYSPTTPFPTVLPIGPATAQLAEYIDMVPRMDFSRAWRRAMRDDRRLIGKRQRARLHARRMVEKKLTQSGEDG